MPLPKHLKNKYNYLNTAPVNCMINSLFISPLNPVSVRQLYRLTLPIYNIFLEQKNEIMTSLPACSRGFHSIIWPYDMRFNLYSAAYTELV